MLKAVFLIVLLSGAAILFLAARKPNRFRYERRIAIKASPEKIRTILNDLRQGALWSPFEQLDPAMKKTFSGPDTGVGSAYLWDGNSKAGAGRMEIIESNSLQIILTLDFFRPFKANNMASFTLDPSGDETLVTWAMYGPTRFPGKIVSLFIDCEQIVGKDFDSGLANLKKLAER